jgi:DNA-binding transcriptional MerR regulator
MDKTQDAFRTIGEVAEELDLPQHVLRFWETKFNQIRPVKRVGGRRYYRPEDVQLVSAIRILLYSEGYTIRGVQRILKEQGARALIAASRGNVRALPPPRPEDEDQVSSADELAAASPAQGAFEQTEMALESPGGVHGAGVGVTCLSPQDRDRMEAVLVELAEGARILAEAGRG